MEEETTQEETVQQVEQVKVALPNPKKARAEGNRVAQAIKGTKAEFYVSDVDLDDQISDVILAAESVRKTLGKNKAGFMIISAGVTNLIVIVDIPPSDEKKLLAKVWLTEALKGISNENLDDATDEFAKANIKIDSPFKLKDAVRATAFAYLRKCGLLDEEESEEEVFDF